MDFFQNQQFDDAISYLSPFAATDSSNLQLLSFLGYANYMNDDAKARQNYYAKYLTTAKPETADEKKAYRYVKAELGIHKLKKS